MIPSNLYLTSPSAVFKLAAPPFGAVTTWPARNALSGPGNHTQAF